jgi:predicted phage tail protein
MPTPAELIIEAQKSAEQLAKREKQKALANSVRNSAKTAIDKQATDNKIKTIKKQTLNRNIYIGVAMVVGALGGFLIAKGMKTPILTTVLATVGGSLVLGVPAILLTKKDAAARKEEMKSLEAKKSTVIDTPKGVMEQAIQTVENITSVIPKAPSQKIAGSGVLTIEEQNKLAPAPFLANTPLASTNLTNLV